MLVNNYDIETITAAYNVLDKYYDVLDHDEAEVLYSLGLLVERLNDKEIR